jgi:beta-lactamase regulating signal transducer with metallopeptidase domain
MIAAWMLSATLFALLLGVAALAAERAWRTMGREARAPWLLALAGAVVWPAVAPVAAALLTRPATGAARAIVAAVPVIGALPRRLPAVSSVWGVRVDAALLAAWALASLWMLVRLALAVRALARVERSATAEVIAGVPVLVTPTLGPAVFGARRPRLLVPRWLLELDAPLRALVLRHEQEHCRARDPQLTLAVAVAVALVPWNAGVWWITRRLRLAVELDCDTRVLHAGEDRERYGRLLLFIAQRQSQTRLAPMLAESNAHLSRRITAMNASRPTNPRTRVAVLALVAVAAVAWSATYAAALTTPPSLPVIARAAVAQGGDAACLLGPPAAVVVAGTPAPRYPDILRSAGVEGEVLAAFVVDTFGKADPRSLKVLQSTHDLFTASVRNMLPDMTFRPAQVGGRKVKQLVQQPFAFFIARSAASEKPPVAASCSSPDPRGVWRLAGIVVTAP